MFLDSFYGLFEIISSLFDSFTFDLYAWIRQLDSNKDTRNVNAFGSLNSVISKMKIQSSSERLRKVKKFLDFQISYSSFSE